MFTHVTGSAENVMYSTIPAPQMRMGVIWSTQQSICCDLSLFLKKYWVDTPHPATTSTCHYFILPRPISLYLLSTFDIASVWLFPKQLTNIISIPLLTSIALLLDKRCTLRLILWYTIRWKRELCCLTCADFQLIFTQTQLAATITSGHWMLNLHICWWYCHSCLHPSSISDESVEVEPHLAKPNFGMVIVMSNIMKVLNTAIVYFMDEILVNSTGLSRRWGQPLWRLLTLQALPHLIEL
jgi:hypothetical protein